MVKMVRNIYDTQYNHPGKNLSPSNRWWDLPAALLLFVILSSAFLRLVATQWTSNLNLTRTITYLGLIAGMALGYSRFRLRTAGFIAVVYGSFTVIWQLGMTMDPGIAWPERLQSLLGRLSTIITQLIGRKPVFDSIFFLLLMGILFWILSVHAGYSLVRHANPWRIILPTGLAMVVIHSYDPLVAPRLWYLVVYLLFALVLVARLVFLQQRGSLGASAHLSPPNLGIDIVRFTLVATLSLMLVAWTAPRASIHPYLLPKSFGRVPVAHCKEPHDLFDKAFASLRSTVGVVNNSYGANISLGRGSVLSEDVVFHVRGPDLRPVGVRYYWRARVYNSFLNGQWLGEYRGEHPGNTR